MLPNTTKSVSDHEIVTTVTYWNLADLLKAGMPANDTIYSNFKSDFKNIENKGSVPFIAVWPDGVFGVVSATPTTPFNSQVIGVDPLVLIDVYRFRSDVLQCSEHHVNSSTREQTLADLKAEFNCD